VINLSASEMMLAAQAGVMRTVENLVRGAQGAHGSAVDDWSMSIEGALAEWAASKALGIHWPGKGKMRGSDAGSLQIRSTKNPNGCLALHESDKDGDTFVLMVGSGMEWQPKGWIPAHRGKQQQFWRTDIRSPCFMVPQSELNDMAEFVG
jgi:hypothetical protein